MPALPRRWLRPGETAHRAEAIKAILDTPPITPHSDGLVLFAGISSETLLSCLVAIKSLHARLGRGRVALLDDGTLIGADRALLAYHCGDPEIIPASDGHDAALADGPAWRALSTVLKRRGSEYWLWLSSDSVTLGPVPEVEQAIALNASFLLPAEGAPDHALPLRDFAQRAYPDGPASGDMTARLESRLAQIDHPGRRYAQGHAGLMGFAAGGPGLRFAAACRTGLEQLVGTEDLRDQGTAQVVANLLLASESRTVLLPQERYRHSGAAGWNEDTSFVHFSSDDRRADERYAEASQIAITALHDQ